VTLEKNELTLVAYVTHFIIHHSYKHCDEANNKHKSNCSCYCYSCDTTT